MSGAHSPNDMANTTRTWIMTIVVVVLGKIALTLAFSSDYVDLLFRPFLASFADGIIHGNPGSPYAAFQTLQPDAFPYHPAMLYLYSPFQIPSSLWNEGLLWKKFWFVLPSGFADGLIIWSLLKMFPGRYRAVILWYGLSPVVLYAVYMHGQLDLWPTALLFLSVRFLIDELDVKAGALAGLAASFKLHVVAAIPLMTLYLYRKKGFRSAALFLAATVGAYALISLPWYADAGFRSMVLFNPKQSLIFDTLYRFGDNVLYVAVLAVVVIYLRFFAYRRQNRDLLISWIAALFSVFVLLIPPAPGWYLWAMPFLVYFYLKFLQERRHVLYMSGLLGAAYLAYFLGGWTGDHIDLKFLGMPLQLKVTSEKAKGLLFTFLQVSLAANIFAVYRMGVRANRLYTRPGSILIGIAGDSSAGKSTLLESLRRLLTPNVTLLEGDGDHRWERGHEKWDSITHLNPRANYLERQAENLILLKKGEAVERPEYDHTTGRFHAARAVRPSDYIILSGLHPFYLPKMRKIIDLKIFLNTDESLRRHWKIIRDTTDRNYTVGKVIEQIKKRRPDAERYIHPQKDFADLVIEYFPLQSFKEGNAKSAVDIGLKLTLSSDLQVEDLILSMEEENWIHEWDYRDDLKTQYFVFRRHPPADRLAAYAALAVPNLDDILSPHRTWDAGFGGIVQLFALIMIHRRLQEGEHALTLF